MRNTDRMPDTAAAGRYSDKDSVEKDLALLVERSLLLEHPHLRRNWDKTENYPESDVRSYHRT